MYRRFGLLLVFALGAAAGCSGCNKPAADQGNGQGQRLKEMFEGHIALPVRVEGETPLSFEPVRVERSEKDDKGLYEARLVWTYAGKNGPFADYLKDRIQRNTHELSPSFGHVSAFGLHVGYGTADADDLAVPPDGAAGSVPLPRFCATDKPAAVTVRLASATWFEAEIVTVFLPRAPGECRNVGRKLSLVAPGDLPVHFDDFSLDSGDRDAARVGWRLVADRATLARRLTEMSESNPRAAGRDVKSVRLQFTFRDGFGRQLAEDNGLLDLTSGQGTIVLPGLRHGDAIAGVTVRGVVITWKERATRVPLTK